MYILSRLGPGMEIAWSGWIGLGSTSIYGVKHSKGWLVDRDHKSIRGRMCFKPGNGGIDVSKPDRVAFSKSITLHFSLPSSDNCSGLQKSFFLHLELVTSFSNPKNPSTISPPFPLVCAMYSNHHIISRISFTLLNSGVQRPGSRIFLASMPGVLEMGG